MKKMLLALALAAGLTTPTFAADAPTLHYDGATCPQNSDLNIDALGVAFAKVHDKMPLPNPSLDYLDGDALAAFDKAMQDAGGPAKPDNVAAVVFIKYDGWSDNPSANPVQMLMFDKDGCFIGGKLVPASFVIKGEGAPA